MVVLKRAAPKIHFAVRLVMQSEQRARSASTTRTKNTKFILRDADARQSDRRRLDVAIVGLPNAGKSQMLNILTQSTVSAVSRKRHTVSF